MANNGVVHLTEANAVDLIGAGIRFAADDTHIKLDLAGNAINGIGDIQLNEQSVSLSSLGKDGLGVDVLDVGGSSFAGQVRIGETDAVSLIDAGLSFAGNDQVTLDVTSINDGAALGSFLGIRTHDGGDLHHLGVDTVVVLKEALEQALVDPTHQGDALWDLDAFLMSNQAPALKVAIDSQSGQAAGDQPVQLSLEIKQVVDDLVSAGVDFAKDASMGDLLDALSEAGLSNMDTSFDSGMLQQGLLTVTGHEAVQGFVAQADANVVMSDELARALADAGMFEAVPQAKVQIDAGSNELLKTPFKLLAEFGVDNVTTTHDKLYIELGDVKDLKEMASMLEGLLGGKEDQGLFHHEDGTDVQAALVVNGHTSEALAQDLLSSDAVQVLQDLQKLGVKEIEFKSGVVAQNLVEDVSIPVEILGGDSYNSVDLQKLLDKHGMY